MQFGRTSNLDGVDFSLASLSPRAEALLARAQRSTNGASDVGNLWLRLGAPAFRHRDWLGTLYPVFAPETDWLRIYAHKLGALELNSTFYGLPSEATLTRWCEDTPPQFRFCPKVPRAISHELGGAQRGALTASFVQRLQRLGERLGPALLQLPETAGPSAQPAIRTALESFPEDFPVAVELRHPGWFERGALRDDLAQWLEARGIACVITDVAGRRDVCHGSLTVPHAFVRFVGEGGHATDEPRTAVWIDRLQSWRQRGLHDAYFFVHQPDDILAPQLLAAASAQARARGIASPKLRSSALRQNSSAFSDGVDSAWVRFYVIRMTTAEESQILREIDLWFRSIPGARTETRTVRDVLSLEAGALLVAHASRKPIAAYVIRGDQDRDGTQAATDSALCDASLTRDDALECMSRWHVFADLSEALAHAPVVDPAFEAACDAIVDGDALALRTLLASTPSLARARSPFSHHQTLLQHVAANGIELSRQWQSPANAVEIAEILLAAGAEPDATCDSYGGGMTALTLLVSSAHPARAGVQAPLVETLCRHGAQPDGPDDDGMPLWTAIVSFHPAAADALVRCGARVDNLLFAAATGDLNAVRSYFDADGQLIPARAFSWGGARALAHAGRPGRMLDPRHVLEYAVHWAAAHRRAAVVDHLLAKQPDLHVKEPLWNNTLLDGAQFGGDPEIIAKVQPLFDDRGRPR